MIRNCIFNRVGNPQNFQKNLWVRHFREFLLVSDFVSFCGFFRGISGFLWVHEKYELLNNNLLLKSQNNFALELFQSLASSQVPRNTGNRSFYGISELMRTRSVFLYPLKTLTFSKKFDKLDLPCHKLV